MPEDRCSSQNETLQMIFYYDDFQLHFREFDKRDNEILYIEAIVLENILHCVHIHCSWKPT